MTATTAAPADFGFGPEESLLRDTARKLLADALPTDTLHRLVAADETAVYERGERPSWDEALWRRLVALGWAGLAVPEDLGGAGCKLAAITALVEEVGRAALPSPLLPTLAATYVLRAAATDGARRWLERVASGTTLSLAWSDADGSWTPSATQVEARRDGEHWLLEGSAHFVQDAFKVDALLVAARSAGDILLFALPVDTPGLALEQEHIHDLTRDQATIRMGPVRVADTHCVSRRGDAAVDGAWPALLVLIAADLCGTGEWQLQTTAEYARTRVQFERPIGFFQAVKHPLVDGMLALDRARALLYHAAACFDANAPDAGDAARMAKSAASDAGAFLSDRSVQLHGGIGFTWECAVHIYFKRSLHNQALFGDGVEQRRQLADRLIGPVATDSARPETPDPRQA